MAVAVNDTTVAATQTVEAGVTPNSPFWALDVFFDKFFLSFIQDPTTRAEYELKVSSERLSEMKEMEKINDKSSMLKALDSHSNFFNELELEIKKIDEDDVRGELDSRLRIDSEFDEHSRHIEAFERELGEDDDSRFVRESLNKDISGLRSFIETELNGTIIRAEREFGEEEVKAIINGTLFEIEIERGRIEIEAEGRLGDRDDDRFEHERREGILEEIEEHRGGISEAEEEAREHSSNRRWDDDDDDRRSSNRDSDDDDDRGERDRDDDHRGDDDDDDRGDDD